MIKETLLTAIIQELIQQVISNSKALIKGITGKDIEKFKSKVNLYLNSQKHKNAYLKTLLHRIKPIYLYDIYYPLKIKYEENVIQTNSLENVFEMSNCAAFSGEAGSGKSTLVKHLFLRTLFEKKSIPILIELRYIKSDREDLIINLIRRALVIDGQEQDKLLEGLLECGGVVIFFDGFDEVAADIRAFVLRSINDFVVRYSKNRYIITSRPFTNMEYMPSFHNYIIEELGKEDIEGFVKQQIEDIEIIEKIVRSINETKESRRASRELSPEP